MNVLRVLRCVGLAGLSVLGGPMSLLRVLRWAGLSWAVR